MPRERTYDYPETEYTRAIERLGWSQVQAGRMLGINPRSSRRYVAGDREIPVSTIALLRLAVRMKFDDSDFNPGEDHSMVMARAIYRRKIGEKAFFDAVSTPIK